MSSIQIQIAILFAGLVAIPCLAAEVVPPRLDTPIAMGSQASAGEQLALADREVNFTLFLPDGWTNAPGSNFTLGIHFHLNPTTTIREHVRRGSRDPLAIFVLGSGSAAYARPFQDTNRFDRILTTVEGELRHRSGFPVQVTSVDVSSFSAGYGAVRELMRAPAVRARIGRVLLLDSLYGGLEAQPPGFTNRVPLADHITVWEPFARSAVNREKTFVITTSQVPTPSYASTRECAEALLDRFQLKLSPVSGMESASTNLHLLSLADSGNFHVWSYSGTNATAHMAHVLHMADVWRAVAAPPR